MSTARAAPAAHSSPAAAAREKPRESNVCLGLSDLLLRECVNESERGARTSGCDAFASKCKPRGPLARGFVFAIRTIRTIWRPRYLGKWRFPRPEALRPHLAVSLPFTDATPSRSIALQVAGI